MEILKNVALVVFCILVRINPINKGGKKHHLVEIMRTFLVHNLFYIESNQRHLYKHNKVFKQNSKTSNN